MRLQRTGRKNDASFRVVVTDSRRGPKSGKHVDLLGSYNPKMNNVQIDGEKAKSWIAKGVQVSDTVHNLLVGQKVIEGKKINVLPRKSPVINEAKVKAEAEAAAAKEAKEAAEKAAAEAPAEEAAPEADVPAEAETEATPEEAPVEAEAPVEPEAEAVTEEAPAPEAEEPKA
ncbi:30S ribosomal protein S16 [Candidatus Parcubacteria bacterium]|nr:30S ribosomal protein S16 [Candidatus Parcubacteria bacterium]